MKSKKNLRKHTRKVKKKFNKQKKGGGFLDRFNYKSTPISVTYERSNQLISGTTTYEFQYNICAIYSNPIFFFKTIGCTENRDKVAMSRPTQLRTPCQEMKNITLNSNNKHFILPAATKEDIIFILNDEMNFNTEILFITSHSQANKILCEDVDGKCYLERRDENIYICDENQLMSSDEFNSNLQQNNIKLLFFNCCSMSYFALDVSKKFPNLYIICWSTEAEDVSCLEFQKKILHELNNLQGKALNNTNLENVYNNAATSFIHSCGNIERIQDPSTITNIVDLIKLRPTGLNCLINNNQIINSLEDVKQIQPISIAFQEVPELL